MARDKSDKTDATPAQLNEWGIPNWRDPAAYGDVKRWTFNRWRWEFYRRRDDLRSYFDARQNAAGTHAMVDDAARARFGYVPLPNPRIGGHPATAIRPWENDGTVTRWEAVAGHNGFRGTLGDLLGFAGVVLTDEQRSLLAHALEAVPANLGGDKIAIGFDLNRPLKPQVEMALVSLRHAYRERGRPVQRKRHREKWLGYLRALDARAAGASWAEIAGIFPATAGTPQAGRDIWEAANALRSNF